MGNRQAIGDRGRKRMRLRITGVLEFWSAEFKRHYSLSALSVRQAGINPLLHRCFSVFQFSTFLAFLAFSISRPFFNAINAVSGVTS
jgi:hypothetical protein